MIRRKIHNRLIRIVELTLEKSKILSDLYTKFFTRMTLNEFDMAELPDKAKILVIGSGPVPHTLLILGSKRNWLITGIDRDERAIKKAKLMIKKQKLEKNILLKNQDGLTVKLSDYDLVVIAHGVEPKDKLLERIIKDASPKTLILYRTTWELLDIVYGKEKLPEQAKVKKIYYRPDFIKSILLESKPT